MRLLASKMKNHSESEKSFTLLEVVIVLGILSVGITVPFFLISRTLTHFYAPTSQVAAVYLAQEGIEIVRNMRDSDWIKGSWIQERWKESDYLGVYAPVICENPGASGCHWSAYEVDYTNPDIFTTDSIIGQCSRITTGDSLSGFLIDSNGFFCKMGSSGCNGTGTLFKRAICLIGIDIDSDTNAEIIMVRSWVIWEENGKEFEVLAEEKIYDWY